MSLPSGISPCCLRGFQWSGTPAGMVGRLASNNAYITGDNPDVAILVIHDLFGWEFPNTRLLADHLAREAGATVYVPDFFGGAHLPWAPMAAGRFEALGASLPGFSRARGRCARASRASAPRASATAGGRASDSPRPSTGRPWWTASPSATRRS